MSLLSGILRGLAAAALCVTLAGCLPSSQSPLDEQKEPHFLTGMARQNALDFKGAIEAFEKALEANPQNGSAHFQLGLLQEKEADYAAAIYHFERFLKLRPDSDYAAIVKERITADKMELSKTAAFAPVTQKLQLEFEKLAEENKQLRAELEKWRALAAQQQERAAAAATRPVQNSGYTPPNAGSPALSDFSNPAAATSRPTPTAATRTHTVKPGETPTAIARKYGVKVESLMAANPGVDARRIKVGQVLRIPSS